MTFQIKLLPKNTAGSELGNAGQYGEIQLDDYSESFVAIIGYWSPRDYWEHWRKSVVRLVRHKENSCLITSLHDPEMSDMLEWWLLYPHGYWVAVQNALLLLREVDPPFDINNPYASIPERRITNDDGYAISEWQVPLSEFESFLAGIE